MANAGGVVSGAPGTGKGGKYLTFSLAGEEYGIEILKVHEIIGMMPVTRVPRTPQIIRGVINLRGKVIPIVDLRRKFELSEAADGGETCIIVVQVHNIQTGLVVDSVSEVIDIPADDVEDAPAFGDDVSTEYLLGLAKSNGRVKMLLDIERVLESGDVKGMQAAVETAA